MKTTFPSEIEIFPRKRADDYRVGVVYPAPYAVGSGNLGFQWAVHRIGSTPGFACERFFLPGPAGNPPRSLESGRAAADFHILAFSVSFEPDYLTAVRFLLLAGIPPESRDRDRRHPLVIAGGAALQVNPEPLAPFVDIMLIGEGEGVLAEFLQHYYHTERREDLLADLAGKPSIYVPALVEVETGDQGGIRRLGWSAGVSASRRHFSPRVTIPALPAARFASTDPPFTNIISPDSEFPSTLLVEIARGCPMGCRYCWAGFRYLPLRAFPASRILDLARQARPVVSKIGLVSTAVCQHPELDSLLGELRGMDYGIGVSSLRLMDITSPLLDALAGGGESTITLAPETGSDTLRRRINKGFSTSDILDQCRLVFTRGIARLKIYLMAGLPWETRDDLEQSAALIAAIARLRDQHQLAWGRPGKITVDIHSFVPKPHTPFQYVQMESIPDLRRKIRFLTHAVKRLSGVEVHAGSVRDDHFQWRLATGTRRTGRALLDLAAGKVSLDDFLLQHPGWHAGPAGTSPEEPPWSILDWGLAEAYLREEWEQAGAGRLTPPCPGAPDCRRCGICKEDQP